MILILVYTSNHPETLAKSILKKKLAHNIDILEVETISQDLDKSKRYLMIIKTRKELFDRINDILHRDTNEIFSLKVRDCNIEFLHRLEADTSIKKIMGAGDD